MADKKQFDGSETSKKSKSRFSLSRRQSRRPPPRRRHRLIKACCTRSGKSVSGKFAKPAQPQEEKPAAQEPEAELFEDDHPLARAAARLEPGAGGIPWGQYRFGPGALRAAGSGLDGGELLRFTAG